MDGFRKNLLEIFNEFALSFDNTIYNKILDFEAIFNKWNTTHNLASLSSRQDFYYKHVFDALVLTTIINKSTNNLFYDLGSGNGIPGIICALVLCAKEFVLVDSKQNKCIFLNYAIRKLELNNAKILNSSFDKLEYPTCSFDVFSRALGLYEKQIDFFSKTLVSKIYFMATEEILKKILKHELAKTKFKTIESDNFYYKILNKKFQNCKNKTIITVV